MQFSRRGMCLWLSSIATATRVRAGSSEKLTTKVSRYEDLPATTHDGNSFRPLVEGLLHDGHAFEAHATELAPGAMPHAPHHHLHEEMFLVREGNVEVTVNDHAKTLGPGGVAFIASGDEHGIKNIGEGKAKYFVIALGHD